MSDSSIINKQPELGTELPQVAPSTKDDGTAHSSRRDSHYHAVLRGRSLA